METIRIKKDTEKVLALKPFITYDINDPKEIKTMSRETMRFNRL